MMKSGLDKSSTGTRDILKTINLQIAVFHYFFTSMLMNILFQFSKYVKQLQEIRCTCMLKQTVC